MSIIQIAADLAFDIFSRALFKTIRWIAIHRSRERHFFRAVNIVDVEEID